MVLNQVAFQAGPLTASLPAATTVDPLVSIAIGIWIYDERIHHGAGAIAAELFCLAVMTVATIGLSRLEAEEETKRIDEHSRTAEGRDPRRVRELASGISNP